MLVWLLVGIAGLVVLYISRSSITKPRSHGFWRFWTWELMLVLLGFNVLAWFVDPFSWHQILSWMLLFLSLVPVILGLIELKKSGKQSAERVNEEGLYAFEKTSALVTTGIYRFIRHPLYSSLLLLTWGIFFKSPQWVGGLLALTASVCLVLTALADEKECVQFFGQPYVEYMGSTKRFIPFLF